MDEISSSLKFVRVSAKIDSDSSPHQICWYNYSFQCFTISYQLLGQGLYFRLNLQESHLILKNNFCKNQLILNWKQRCWNLYQMDIKSVGAVNMVIVCGYFKCQFCEFSFVLNKFADMS